MNKIFRVEAKQNPQDSTGIWTAMLINYLISIERSYSLILWYCGFYGFEYSHAISINFYHNSAKMLIHSGNRRNSSIIDTPTT